MAVDSEESAAEILLAMKLKLKQNTSKTFAALELWIYQMEKRTVRENL